MIYAIIGPDWNVKTDRIHKLRDKILADPQSRHFDYDAVDGQKTDAVALKQRLIALPAMAKQRVVLVREAHKLDEKNLKIIEDFASQDHSHAVLILDFDKAGKTQLAWIKSLAGANVLNLQPEEKEINVFDVTRCIPRQPAEALKLLNQLYDSGNHPLKIMPGLVWFWGKMRAKISSEQYKKGLLCLQEADLNIKRSRLKAEYALEVLILKLCSLAA